MEKIKVSKAELIATLEANRKQHREVFLKALEGFRERALELFEQQIARLKSGNKLSDVSVHLTVPRDQTRDYDRAIGMLKLSLDDVITLSEADYTQYVLDDWAWKTAWKMSNKAYYTATAAVGSLPQSYVDDEDDDV